MLIDWFTVAAQAVNFIILLVLLKVLLYKRVLGVLDERQRRLKERDEEATRQRDQAQREAAELAAQRRELDNRRQELLDQARQEADQFASQRREQARQEVQQQKQAWLQTMSEDREAFLERLRRELARNTARLAGRALEDLADQHLEDRVRDVFLRRLGEIDDDQRTRFLHAARGSVQVRSAWQLDDQARKDILQALREHLDEKLDADFDTDGKLVCGMEVSADGLAIGWNVHRYVEDLIDQVERTIRHETDQPEGEPAQAQQEATA